MTQSYYGRCPPGVYKNQEYRYIFTEIRKEMAFFKETGIAPHPIPGLHIAI